MNMHTLTYRLLTLVTPLLFVAGARAESADTVRSDTPAAKEKIVTNARMIGIGSTNILDTYISPEKYRGTELRYISHTVRERTGSETSETGKRNRLATTLIHQGYLSLSDNRAGEGGAIAGMYSFSYGRHLQWMLTGGALRLKAGAQADGNIGFLYNTRNGNNPAQARLNIDIAPMVGADYRFTAFERWPLTVAYEASIPIVGVVFSPNYGQSYYEIFNEGNYDHNIVPTTIGCAPSLRQMLTIDLRLKKIALRIGYMGDIQQYKVNNLKYHNYSHLFLIGFVKRFKSIRLKP